MHSLMHHMQFPMVFCGRHCTPATLGLLGPILCAWVLVRVALVSFWLVSRLVFPITLMLLCDLPHMYAFRLVSPWLLYLHVFRIWCLFLLFSPWLPLCIYDLKSMYVSPVCILTSICGYSPTRVQLKSSVPFDIFRLRKLFDSWSFPPSTCTFLEDYFCGTLNSATSLLGSTYTCL